MDLIIWRHAEAEDKDTSDDLERQLTPRGEKQAARMAAWLDRHLPEGARIVCSPARRTEQTVLALGRKYKLRKELAPDGTVEDLLEVARWPQGKGAVLIVGHQPTLGAAIARLMGIADGESVIRKGAVWWLRTRERDGVMEAVIVTVQTPDMV
ncbi:MAG: histidine phosphatase family protein [Comamonadaceae bacterium]|nr:MAG: histidine phosphatase family protein [Comamonadaceae bacterium]